MGFRARSADEMYRYAFRLEDRDRSLCDGFGWTILLLGDSARFLGGIRGEDQNGSRFLRRALADVSRSGAVPVVADLAGTRRCRAGVLTVPERVAELPQG
jgi:hypothetical protein